MFNRLIYYIFSFLLLLSSITTNVDGVLCLFNQSKCLTYNESWCCDEYKFCGHYSNNCIDFETTTQTNPPSPEFPSGLLTVLILVPFFLLTICVCTGLQSRQDRENQHSPATHQQPTSLILIRRNCNVNISPTVNSIYEEPPPSYETAMTDLPPKYT